MSLPESDYHATGNWEPYSTMKDILWKTLEFGALEGKFSSFVIAKLISSNIIMIPIACFPVPFFSNPAKAYSNCLFIDMMIQKK